MKKHLLMGSAIFAAICAYPQTGSNQSTNRVTDMAKKLSSKYEIIRGANENLVQAPNLIKPTDEIIKPVNEYKALVNNTSSSINQQTGNHEKALTSINWNRISGSMNIYGMLEISGKPLQYNNELNAVSFVHRKSQTYNANPVPTTTTALTGVIVGMVSTDCGVTWDSTCIWNNNTNWARYPQGALYNPPGNTNIANAYVVGTGPVTSASSNWQGSWLASKKLDAVSGTGYDNVASTVSGAQQFIANTPPFGPTSKFDYPSYSFSSTDDGVLRTLGLVVNDFNGTGSARQYRGARIVKGSFTSGVFNWTADSAIVSPLVITDSNGDKQVLGEPHMAWSEDGGVGYVVQFGCRLNPTSLTNSGFQPIIHKYTTANPNWSLIPAIDFTQPQFQNTVMKMVPGTLTNTNLVIPFFNTGEGIDLVVDKDNNLHIVTTLFGTSSSDPDSLGFVHNFNNGGETYNYKHSPGRRPYIFDIMQTTGGGWKAVVIDSMSSEAPGERPNQSGFTDNPWDAVGGTGGSDKVSSAARLQASRTPDGKYIIYTWAESDTNFTSSGKKWNSIPNIKARAFDVNYNVVSNNEINLTPSSVPQISTRAQMHHISPTSAFISATPTATPIYTLDVDLPVTVSTNQSNPLTQLLPNDHWYSCARLSFLFPSEVGLKEINNIIQHTSLYPNPANRVANLRIDLKSENELNIKVMNLIGEVVKNTTTPANSGENNFAINLDGLNAGIYLVKINAGNASVSTKLIIE